MLYLELNRAVEKFGIPHSNHGGDLIAISKEFISSEIKELHTDYEIVWAEINIAGTKKIIIGSYSSRSDFLKL
jgi:hypothetical protein